MDTETLIRCSRLRAELKPVPILTGIAAEPIAADWVGITLVITTFAGRSDSVESYLLSFYQDDGLNLETMQFETLDIALDQAKAIVGVERSEWRVCEIDLLAHDKLSWQFVEENV